MNHNDLCFISSYLIIIIIITWKHFHTHLLGSIAATPASIKKIKFKFIAERVKYVKNSLRHADTQSLELPPPDIISPEKGEILID